MRTVEENYAKLFGKCDEAAKCRFSEFLYLLDMNFLRYGLERRVGPGGTNRDIVFALRSSADGCVASWPAECECAFLLIEIQVCLLLTCDPF